ncbi:vWA domain-containing protein [Lentisalinibacter salinarum]|uniref:vWA domain-containing protein n=1 Tax=Lentisalinibacter salinarum TaxID=2992239 RepID=UPI0038678329
MSADAAAAGEAFREHLILFVRTLRHAGLGLGPGDTRGALEAAAATGLRDRDDLRRALAASLVRSPRDMRLFRQAFGLFFERPQALRRLADAAAEPEASGAAEDGLGRLAQALAAAGHGRERPRETRRAQRDRRGGASALEVLRRKDFEQMSAEERSTARALLREAVLPLATLRTRRYTTHDRGPRPDLRATLRRGVRQGGEFMELERRRPRRRPPPLVLLADISGSMSRYTRMFLHFAHALTARGERVHTFLFGTRLSAVTRRLRDRDPDRALALVADDIRDWDGGTRIADSLHEFNRDWGRRVLGQGAVVLLLTDGLERDPDARLGREMERLGKSCRRLVWLNPLLRYDGFRPRARGMRLMLPHADDLVPAHNVDSLEVLAARLGDSLQARRQTRPR